MDGNILVKSKVLLISNVKFIYKLFTIFLMIKLMYCLFYIKFLQVNNNSDIIKLLKIQILINNPKFTI